jgi:WD40 repeat protein
MAWPLSQDYNEAIQNPQTSFSDPELRRGEVSCNAFGIPMPRSGNFADVYEVKCPNGSRWAVKCFTRQVPGLRERYSVISRHLQQAKLPFTVEFSYLEQGIRVHGQWYPVLKMQWVEGLTLNEFLRAHRDKPVTLEALLHIWVRMARFLRDAHIGHCDLQHGNILLVTGSTANSVAIKLIDYDGMWVPALAGKSSGEVGHPCYQHPQRLREATHSLEVDRFPLLLIATALRSLVTSGAALWDKYDNGDNLLFKEADLQAPTKSHLFADLFRSNDPLVRPLIDCMITALRGRLEAVPLVDELIPLPGSATPVPGAPARPARNSKLLPTTTVPAWAVSPVEYKTAPEGSRPVPLKKSRGALPWILGGLFLGLAAAGGGAFWAMHRGAGNSAPAPDETRHAHHEHKDTDGGKPPNDDTKAPARDTKTDSGRSDKPPRDNSKTDPKKDNPADVTQNDAKRDEPSKDGRKDDPIKDGTKKDATEKGPTKDSTRKDSPRDDAKNPADDPAIREVHAWKQHKGAVRAVSVSADGKRALSCGEDKMCWLWDLEMGKEVGNVCWDEDWVRAVALLPDGAHALIGSKKGELGVYDITKTKWKSQFIGHTGSVNAVDVSRDGRLAISGGNDREIWVWNVNTAKEVRHWTGHGGPITVVRFSADARRALSFGRDHKANLWDVGTGRTVGDTIQGEAGRDLIGATLSPDGKWVLCSFSDGNVSLWDIQANKYAETLQIVATPPHTLAFSPGGKYIVTVTDGIGDKAAPLFRMSDQKQKDPRQKSGTPISPGGVVFTRDGRRAVIAGADGVVRVWEVPPDPEKPVAVVADPEKLPRQLYALKGHTGAIRDLSISGKGNRGLTIGADNVLRLWDLVNGEQILEIKKDEGEVVALALLPDGKQALLGDKDGMVLLWDWTQNDKDGLFLPIKHKGGVTGIDVSSDGKTAITTGADGIVRVFDLEKRVQLRRWADGKDTVEFMRLTRDGTHVLTCNRDGKGRMWLAGTGALVGTNHPEDKLEAILSLALSPDGQYFVAGARGEGVAALFEAKKKEWVQVGTLDGHRGPVHTVEFSPGGRYIITADADPTDKPNSFSVWTVRPLKRLCTVQGSPVAPGGLRCTPDGRRLVTAGTDGILRVWELPENDPPKAIEKPEREPEKKDPDKLKPEPMPKGKQRPPAEAEVKAAIDRFKALNEKVFARASQTDKGLQGLSDSLFAKAIQTKEDLVLRFALLVEAHDLAARGGDPVRSLKVIDELARDYAVEAFALKIEAVKLSGKSLPNPATAKAVLDAALVLLDEARGSDNYEAVVPLLPIVRLASAASRNAALSKSAEERATEMERLRKEYAAIKTAVQTLKDKPDDQAANLALGKFLCLHKHDWEKGVPLLIKGGDAALAAVAKKELAAPTAADEREALADAWLELAKGATGPLKSLIQRRAYHWHMKALPELTGEAQTRVEKRIAELLKAIPDLQPSWDHLDLSGAKLQGLFLQLPTNKVLATRKSFTGPIEVSVAVRVSKNAPRLDVYHGKDLLLSWANETNLAVVTRPPDPAKGRTGTVTVANNLFSFAPNTWHTLTWRLSEEGVKVLVDGAVLMDDAEVKPDLIRPKPIVIQAKDSALEFKSFEVKPFKP